MTAESVAGGPLASVKSKGAWQGFGERCRASSRLDAKTPSAGRPCTGPERRRSWGQGWSGLAAVSAVLAGIPGATAAHDKTLTVRSHLAGDGGCAASSASRHADRDRASERRSGDDLLRNNALFAAMTPRSRPARARTSSISLVLLDQLAPDAHPRPRRRSGTIVGISRRS